MRKVPGGVNDSHITVVYLGKDLDDEAFANACDRASWAAWNHYPMRGLLHGVETFPPSDSSDHKVPAFVPAFVPGIGALRRQLADLNASKHTDYRPHVTLAYLEPGDPLPPPHPPVHVDFTHLSVQRGDDVVHFPLGEHAERPAPRDDQVLRWWRTSSRGCARQGRDRRASLNPALGRRRIIQRTAQNGGHLGQPDQRPAPVRRGTWWRRKTAATSFQERTLSGKTGTGFPRDYVQAHHAGFQPAGSPSRLLA